MSEEDWINEVNKFYVELANLAKKLQFYAYQKTILISQCGLIMQLPKKEAVMAFAPSHDKDSCFKYM